MLWYRMEPSTTGGRKPKAIRHSPEEKARLQEEAKAAREAEKERKRQMQRQKGKGVIPSYDR